MANHTLRNSILFISSAILAGCGGSSGPSKSEMMSACLDGGTIAEKRVSGPNSRQICSCMLGELGKAKLSSDDKENLVQHWQSQSTRSYGGRTLPGSIEAKASSQMPRIQRCFF